MHAHAHDPRRMNLARSGAGGLQSVHVPAWVAVSPSGHNSQLDSPVAGAAYGGRHRKQALAGSAAIVDAFK
eukprot:5214882-Prymnesium_polylepis.2